MASIGNLYTVRVIYPNPNADFTLTVRAPRKTAVWWAAADALRQRKQGDGVIDLASVRRV